MPFPVVAETSVKDAIDIANKVEQKSDQVDNIPSDAFGSEWICEDKTEIMCKDVSERQVDKDEVAAPAAVTDIAM